MVETAEGLKLGINVPVPPLVREPMELKAGEFTCMECGYIGALEKWQLLVTCAICDKPINSELCKRCENEGEVEEIVSNHFCAACRYAVCSRCWKKEERYCKDCRYREGCNLLNHMGGKSS